MKFILICFLAVSTSAVFANDTLYFRLSNPENSVKATNGKYLRKAIQMDSGWLALDYNERHILVSRSFYIDTNFNSKLHCQQHFNEAAGYLEEIRCYKDGSLNGLNIFFNGKGDTLLRNRFVNNEIVDSKQFPGYENQTRLFEKVEVEATFEEPGGWGNFMNRHLKANVPVKRHAPNGTYQVIIQFIIDKDGSVTQLKPLTAFGYGMEEEVMRVIQKSPKWRPATQNNKPVKAYRKQPITFIVTGKNK